MQTKLVSVLFVLGVGCTGVGAAPPDDDGGSGDELGGAGTPLDPDRGSTPGEPTPAVTCFEQTLAPEADISDIVAVYGGSAWKDELIAAMERRWPAGAWLLEEQRDDSYFGQFSDPSSWPGMMESLATLVHEETHLFNAYHAQAVGEPWSLYYGDDRILYPPLLDDFPRSEIRGMLAPGTDGYDLYLEGEQGSRGFDALLDELSCYTNELAGMGVMAEYYEGLGFSLKDGSVAFLYYMQLYLRRARTHHSAFYEAAAAEESYRQAVLWAWLRVHLYREVVKGYDHLAIDEEPYLAQIYRPENLAEIEMFTGVKVGASACALE